MGGYCSAYDQHRALVTLGLKKKQRIELDLYYVNEDDEDFIMNGIGFAKNLFHHNEWPTLKALCLKRNIKQPDLNGVYNRYLTDAGVFIREHRVLTGDTKNGFIKKTKVLAELADIYLPMIYLKDYPGLDKPHSPEEISFSRFVITGYIFCNQPFVDLIYDFLSILRRRLNMKMHAVMFTFNFYQIAQTLSEELKPSVTLSYVLRYANIKNDTEISAESIIKLGLKYPVLFFPLLRFRNHMRRLIFGDKFWANQKLIKPRTEFQKNDIDPLLYIDGTVDEDAAVVCTARSIITDYAKGNMTSIKLVEEYPQQVTYVDTELSVKMKTLLGYKMARKLIIESKLPYAETELYVDVPDEEGDEDIRMHDPMIQLDFTYNAGTGLHSWFKTYFDPVTGDPIRETATRFTPNLSEIDERKNSMQESGEDPKHGELKSLTMAKEKKKKNK